MIENKKVVNRKEVSGSIEVKQQLIEEITTQKK